MITKFENVKKQRVYIGNFVARHYTGDRKCANCGSEDTTILHNLKEPYKINFICNKCRFSLDQEQLNNLPKINLLDYVDSTTKYSSTKNMILEKNLKQLIEGVLITDKSLTQYLKDNNFTYHRYRVLLELYEKEVRSYKRGYQKSFRRK